MPMIGFWPENVARTRGQAGGATFPGRARSSVITDANLTPRQQRCDDGGNGFACTRRKYDFRRRAGIFVAWIEIGERLARKRKTRAASYRTVPIPRPQLRKPFLEDVSGQLRPRYGQRPTDSDETLHGSTVHSARYRTGFRSLYRACRKWKSRRWRGSVESNGNILHGFFPFRFFFSKSVATFARFLR